MGWSYGIVEGKEVGYAVDATCEFLGCNKKIDRGLAYKCGDYPGSGDDFCNGYFCYDHLVMTKNGQRCEECSKEIE